MADLLWQLPLALVVLVVTVSGALALWFRGPSFTAAQFGLIGLWSLTGLAFITTLWLPDAAILRTPAAIALATAFATMGLWWASIRPQQHRNWAADVDRLLSAEIDGDQVRLHNVRNFAWRTREDFTPRWETRRYDLSALHSADLIVSYWMGPAVAHTLVSFGFADGRQLVFSVEVRRTQGQLFSALGGFFKQSELLLVAADERDIVRTRSNVRGEAVYLYRVGLSQPAMRELFIAYLDVADDLQRQPRFYNTVVSNCTTIVFDMIKQIVPGLPADVRLLLSGYLPGYIYDLGALDTSRPLDELQRRGHINPRAIASDTDGQASADFTTAIRRGVPAPDGRLIETE